MRRLDWRRLARYLLDPGADATVKLADIDAGRLMNWMVAAAAHQEAGAKWDVEFHVVGQGYELQAPGIDHLFIEPRRHDDETTSTA